VHFSLWIPSLRLTSVTASTALVATTPLWTVALAWWWGGQRPSRTLLAGVALALAGVVAITGVDAAIGVRALAGDALALGGGMAGACYVLAGEQARRSVSTAVYTVLAYGVAAVLLLAACLLGGQPIAGFTARTWVELAVLMVAAQLLGHSLFAAALPVVGATPASLSILLEVPGAALVAWAWLGTPPPGTVLPGTLLVLAGLVLVIRGRRRADPAPVAELFLVDVAQVTSAPPDDAGGAR
jgi:drug/metabolite transporter (DMT)-like permease